MSTFAGCFWNESLQDFTGFEVLCRRLKTGKRAWKDYIEYLKHRAQIHEAYGKALMKVGKFEGAKEEIGTLRNSWDEVNAHTEIIGANNLSLSMALQEEALSQTKKLEEDNEKRKKVLMEIRKLQNAQKNALKRAEAAKRVYYSKSKQSDQIGQTLLVEIGRTSIHPKEIDKLKTKHNRCMDVAEQADVAYKDSLTVLDEIRIVWEKETVNACQALQQLEEHRIICLRDSLWLTSNLFSSYCVKEDDHQELIRKVIEKLDVQADIKQFIRDNHTGCVKPRPVLYEPYRSDGKQTSTEEKKLQIDINSNCHFSKGEFHSEPDLTRDFSEKVPGEPIYAVVDKSSKRNAPKFMNNNEKCVSMMDMEMEIYESASLYEKYAWRVLHSYEANVKDNDINKPIS